MNIILPGESGVSKYDDDPNAPLYIEDKDIKMTKEEKKHWMAGDDVPVIQATNPWSMQVDDTNVDKDFYKQTLEMPQQPANQILTLGKADFNQNINNVASILRDILAGDPKAMERPEFQALNFPAIKAYLEWAIKTDTLADAAKGDLMNNAWRLNFKCRPPTPEEFLQEKFIGAQAEALHKPLIDIFCEFFDPLKPYRTLVLTQCIGWGKSQPYSAKVGVGYEDVVDFTFDDGEVLTFNENNYVFDGLNFIQAKNVDVSLPQSINLIIMSIYDCRNVKAFEKAFGIDTYDELISFFKNIEIDKEIRTRIHHIIPRSEDGSDDKENLVKLPIYFHIKAHYLRAVECEKSGNKSFAYKNYKAVCYALNKNKIPDNYKDFLKELDICVESLQKRQYYEKKTRWIYFWEIKSIQITKRKRLIYKELGDVKVGDSIMCPGTDKAKVVHINELGISDIYKLTLSDGGSFRTHAKHLTTVSFREEDNKRVWDSLTTEWMMNHPEYHFTVLTDEIYSTLTWDDIEKTLPSHEAEPSDNIIPKTYDGVFIASIEKLDCQENCRCISLNNPEGFYYTDDAIITHNSTLSTLAQLYISVHYAMMWHPYRFFGMAMSSIFTQCLGGWNQKKASELLLEPFTQILEGAPYFQRVRTHQDLVDASAEEVKDCIHWTTSTPTAQPLDSKIIMADGSVKLMGDIQIGDKVKSPSEGTTEVINIPYHGVADCYEIELEDGRTVRCSAEHLWNVRRTPESDWEVVNLQYIMDHPEYDWEIRELDDF